MLVPALEVTCHLLLPRLLGTYVPALSCWESRAKRLQGERSRETRLRKGPGRAGTTGVSVGAGGCEPALDWCGCPCAKSCPSRNGIHTHRAKSKTWPQGISPPPMLTRNPPHHHDFKCCEQRCSKCPLPGVQSKPCQAAAVPGSPTGCCRDHLPGHGCPRGDPEWRGTLGTVEGSASPGAVLAAGSVGGFWPGVRIVPGLPIGPWEGEEEGCVPRDFLGYCWDFFLGRE